MADQSDIDLLQPLDGMHFALLTKDEQLAFFRLKADGKATVEYRGAAGFLGIGHLRMLTAESPE